MPVCGRNHTAMVAACLDGLAKARVKTLYPNSVRRTADLQSCPNQVVTEPGKGMSSPNYSLGFWTINVRQCVHGPKWLFSKCFHSMHQDSCSWSQSFARVTIALEGAAPWAAPSLFRPMYVGANIEGNSSRGIGDRGLQNCPPPVSGAARMQILLSSRGVTRLPKTAGLYPLTSLGFYAEKVQQSSRPYVPSD
jgi:hypothetical protein